MIIFDIDNKTNDRSFRSIFYRLTNQQKALIESGWQKCFRHSAELVLESVFSFPVTEKHSNSMLSMENFVQQPALNETYIGYQRYAYMFDSG